MRSRVKLAATAAAAVLVMSAPPAGAATSATALGIGANTNTLFNFGLSSPGTTTQVAVTGLGGSTLVGIDYRPATGELYGIGVLANTVSVFRIDPATGAATLIGSNVVNTVAGATAFGVDFNPIVDRIRVVNNLASDGLGGNANNFRMNPNDGELAGVDPDLDFTGLPGGNANAPEVAVAYDNSFLGAVVTTLFGVTSGGDRVVINGGAGPGFPTLQNFGLLNVDTSNSAGFDIDAATGLGHAVLEVGGVSGLYTINPSSGAATLVGSIGAGTADFGGLSAPTAVPAFGFANAATSVAEGDAAEIAVVRTGSLGVSSTVNYATELTGSATGSDFTATAGTLTFPAGVATQTFAVPTSEDAGDEADETVGLRLSAPSVGELSQPVSTLTIVDDDDAPPPVDPKAGLPPLGLISVPAQRIDKSIAASFACDEACAADVDLILGRTKQLDDAQASLTGAGVGQLTFDLSRREVRLVKRKARGAKSAKLTAGGAFSDADGTSTTTVKFQLG